MLVCISNCEKTCFQMESFQKVSDTLQMTNLTTYISYNIFLHPTFFKYLPNLLI